MKNTRKILAGFMFSNMVAFMLVWLGETLKLDNGILVLSEFVLVPMVMGAVCAWFWRIEKLSVSRQMWAIVLNTFIAIGLSYILLKEGTLCLLIVSPLMAACMVTGYVIAKGLINRDNKRLNISVFSTLLLIFIADHLSEHHYENMVSDKVVINAPVNEVWQHVVAFKRIEKPNNYWLFNIGMPSPVQATVTGYHKGAGRKCIFSNGYVFDEVISTYQPGKDLTFDVTYQPRDPEIMGHIDILRGQFLLVDNGNNTTTLIGNSWYRLYVFPVWYYDIWAQSITRNVHIRVMEHVKELSEQHV